jgi:hypothetical protein
MFFLTFREILILKTQIIIQKIPKMITKSYLIGVTLLCFVLSAYAKDDKKENYGTVIGIDLGTTYSW